MQSIDNQTDTSKKTYKKPQLFQLALADHTKSKQAAGPEGFINNSATSVATNS